VWLEQTLRVGQTFVLRADYVMNIIALGFVGTQFLLSLGQVAGLSRSQWVEKVKQYKHKKRDVAVASAVYKPQTLAF
jgi:hypothetical protein